jgi:hypothetical protein
MANPANSADKTAQTNEIITADAVEITSSFDDVPTITGSASEEIITIPFAEISTSLYCNTSKVFIYPKKTKEGRDSKLADQQYWIVNYNGKAFTTQDNRFIQALEMNDLYEVRLKRNGEYLEFVGFTPASTKRNSVALLKEINDLEREEAENKAMSTKRVSWINNLDLKSVAPDESLVQRLLGNTVE